MTRYRIYTEDVNKDWIVAFVALSFKSFTIQSGAGYWEGKEEPCLIVEIIGTDKIFEKVHKVAVEIRVQNKQEAVLLTHEPIKGELI